MLTRYIYYELKPLIPRWLRYGLRRVRARKLREQNRNEWPIDATAGEPPLGWPGWPDGKKFAFVLTHDVEGPDGLAKCRQLAELEMELGFRSSFNFIPEGTYTVSAELRRWLTDNGFEVGVHDLHHNGKLFRTRKGFQQQAERINHYLREWQADGFRAGFMHHNLEWQHDIKAQYDASNFDTDPFEPHPTGAGTIFPYWVRKNDTEGFIELPYTLPQDSTLFLVFREATNQIWRDKIDWIAAQGGMGLINTHPDYMDFKNGRSDCHFPIEFYRDLLLHVKQRYAGQYWHALPRDVANYARQNRSVLAERGSSPARGPRGVKIWIDLENTPHIPFFNPIIRELKRRGHSVVLTARDAYQTCEMADLYRLPYKKIGHHYGKKMAMKAFGLVVRVAQLIPYVRRERPALGLNHGARAQTGICNLFGIPSVLIMDYEHTKGSGIGEPRWRIYPTVVVSESSSKRDQPRVLTYSGIKEDVYVPELKPDPSVLDQLGLRDARIVITVRPPAIEAHYHNPEAELLFTHFMNRAVATDGVKVVLLPRNKRQDALIRETSPHWFAQGKVIIPQVVVDGLNLLWFSDLVVSGGGTMNREAAALGVPVYSVFRGTIGAVDRYLAHEGRLTLITSTEEVDQKIRIAPRPKPTTVDRTPRQALSDIVNHIEAIIERDCR